MVKTWARNKATETALNNGWRRLAAVGGGWRLAVGGPQGLSLRAVSNQNKKKEFLRTALLCPGAQIPDLRNGERVAGYTNPPDKNQRDMYTDKRGPDAGGELGRLVHATSWAPLPSARPGPPLFPSSLHPKREGGGGGTQKVVYHQSLNISCCKFHFLPL